MKEVDVGNQFTNGQEFEFRDHMFQWIRTEASKLGFVVVIGRSDNGSDERVAFVIMRCERSGKYTTPLRKFKREYTGSRRCDCLFKLRGYLLSNNKWRFNVICGLHNHDMCDKLFGHPIACLLMPEEKGIVSDMTLNTVQSKNILATLKHKRLGNISNLKQVYNICVLNNKALRGDRTEMKQSLELLDDNNYVTMYRTCEDGVTVRDTFWTHLDSIKLLTCFLMYSSLIQRIRPTIIGFHNWKLLMLPLSIRLLLLGLYFWRAKKRIM